ncbi:MAG TPA: hypothetical protein VGG29_04105 [Caulobacteraceae bacterium]|jgi:hypothetical protein
MAWTDSGPVSVPSRGVVAVVAALIFIAGAAGVGFGLHATMRTGPVIAGSGDQALDSQAVAAQPIVELPPPPAPAPVAAAPSNAAVAKAADKDQADDNDVSAKTAAAQQAQSNPAQQHADVDDILTSQSEKPQAPAKPSTDESAPGTPGKSDVPF